MSIATQTVDLQAPPTPILFTDSAAAKVKDLLIEEGRKLDLKPVISLADLN